MSLKNHVCMCIHGSVNEALKYGCKSSYWVKLLTLRDWALSLVLSFTKELY